MFVAEPSSTMTLKLAAALEQLNRKLRVHLMAPTHLLLTSRMGPRIGSASLHAQRRRVQMTVTPINPALSPLRDDVLKASKLCR